MLNKFKLLVLLGAVLLLTSGRVTYSQVSDAQIWDVQVPNDYAGGARASEGFFFGMEGLYWALPGPKNNMVGSPSANGTSAYYRTWTVSNYSYNPGSYITPSDDEEEEDDEDDSDTDSDADIGDAANILNQYGPLGDVEKTTQRSDWNTNMITSGWEMGTRYQFGFMQEHQGWECVVFTIKDTQSLTGYSVQVGLDDSNQSVFDNVLRGVFYNTTKQDWFDNTSRQQNGNLYVDRMLVEFDKATMSNRIETWGVELNYLRRMHPTKKGMFEWGLGVRYMRYDEEFSFWGGSERTNQYVIYTPNFLDDSTWSTDGQNNMVGPQISLKWSRHTARFSMEILAKFTAAINAQRVESYCSLASNGLANALYDADASIYVGGEVSTPYVVYSAPGVREGTSSCGRETFTEFSPIVELGVKFSFDLTRRIKLSAGWTGIYADGIARGSSMTDYTISSNGGLMGIISENNHSSVFMHGLTLGITLNR
ncbi:MAG: BBP7 family outer membrane beta-barrel protein [Planctomycetia bacterium]|nr:BBP7 family outer membrane beta-barrel protein [Planctomycetia bacterium]